jgi:flagellar biosynthesis protein FlhG
VSAHARFPVTSATLLRQPVVIDQAAKLRALAAQHVTRAIVFAITSGKGGVGKSNVAVNLAIALSQAGKRVVLLDADLGLANADVLAGVEVRTNLAHVIARQRELKDVMIDAPGGFKLIGGASGIAKMADLSDGDRQRLIRALAELETLADVILVDTGAGISPSVLSFTRAADHVLVVTTPEPTAITDAYAAIKVLVRSPGEETSPAIDRRISLLVNQALSPQEASQVYDRVSKVARQFLGMTVFDAGYVPRDDAVLAAVRSRSPFVLSAPRSPAAQCMQQLVIRLGLGGTAAAVKPLNGGFFDRMGRWLFKDA